MTPRLYITFTVIKFRGWPNEVHIATRAIKLVPGVSILRLVYGYKKTLNSALHRVVGITTILTDDSSATGKMIWI